MAIFAQVLAHCPQNARTSCCTSASPKFDAESFIFAARTMLTVDITHPDRWTCLNGFRIWCRSWIYIVFGVSETSSWAFQPFWQTEYTPHRSVISIERVLNFLAEYTLHLIYYNNKISNFLYQHYYSSRSVLFKVFFFQTSC